MKNNKINFKNVKYFIIFVLTYFTYVYRTVLRTLL